MRQQIESAVHEALLSTRREGVGRGRPPGGEDAGFDFGAGEGDLFPEGEDLDAGLDDLEAKIERQRQLAGSGA